MKSLVVVNGLREEDAEDRLFHFPVHGRPVRFGVVEVPRPPFDPFAPGNAHNVLVRVLAFSCNYRDRGLLLLNHEKAERSSLPGYFGFGSDFVGVVDSCGVKVFELEEGDRVLPDSSYPQDREPVFGDGVPTNHASRGWLILPSNKLCKLPEAVSSFEAAALGLNAQTAVSMLRRGRVQRGSRVLVTAGRSNTSLCVSGMAASLGAQVTILSTSKWTAEDVAAAGFPKVLYAEKICEVFDGERLPACEGLDSQFDVIIDPFFDLYCAATLPLLAHGGIYITCGLKNQHSSQCSHDVLAGTGIDPSVLYGMFSSVLVRNQTLIGNCIGTGDDLRRALSLVETGAWRPVINSIGLVGSDCRDLVQAWFGTRSGLGKAVLCLE